MQKNKNFTQSDISYVVYMLSASVSRDLPDTSHHVFEKIRDMLTSSNGNIFRVTGPLYGEFTGHRWIPRKKASDAEPWCFLWSAPEYTVE